MWRRSTRARPADQPPRRSSGHRQQQHFGQRLSCDSNAAGSQSHAQRKIELPLGCAHQQQPSHIGTYNKEQSGDCREQHRHPTPHRSVVVVSHGQHKPLPARLLAIGSIVLQRHPPAKVADARGSQLPTQPWFQTRDHPQVIRRPDTVRQFLGGKCHRRPHLGYRIREFKRARHYAHDSILLRVELHGTLQDARIAGKYIPPVGFAQNQGVRTLEAFLLWSERPSHQRLHVQRTEQAGCHGHRVHFLGAVDAGMVQIQEIEQADIAEQFPMLAQVQIIENGGGQPRQVELRKVVVNRHQLIRTRIRQRLQYRGVQFGENRGACPQAECQRQEDDGRGGGVAPHLRKPALQIAGKPRQDLLQGSKRWGHLSSRSIYSCVYQPLFYRAWASWPEPPALTSRQSTPRRLAWIFFTTRTSYSRTAPDTSVASGKWIPPASRCCACSTRRGASSGTPW